MSVWFGVDPGGDRSFGVAMIDDTEFCRTWCVSCADEAVELIGEEPDGVGVDAPLWWSSGKSSDRFADRWIRKTFGISAGTVQTANSLRGAALVQGVMFVYRLRERYPNVRVTEAHPKAVALALGGWDAPAVRSLGNLGLASEHERDAVMAAFAAREGFSGRWPVDLTKERLPAEQDPSAYWLSPVHYFWPSSA